MPKTRFGPHFGITIGGTSLAYCYIRKNACSAWKRLFINESPHDFSQFHPPLALAFMKKFHKLRSSDAIQSHDRQVLVVRDPVERYISAFLYLFVARYRNPTPRIEELVTTKFENKFEDITFDIVLDRQLPRVGRKTLNSHFWPQTWHIANTIYSDVIPLNSLHDSMVGLVGKGISDVYFQQKTNSTSAQVGYRDECAANIPISELYNRLRETQQYPTKECFSDSGRQKIISEAYFDDVRLFETCRQYYATSKSVPLSLDFR
ncbi:MAG: sulfotransferase family protein [Hyphomicrobiales bacterium]|nr:sulfotransferase family protein [Hyphomicrobiales bacterium]